MILKTPHGTPISLFFLTSDMYSLLAKQKIPFKDVYKLSTYHQQLTFSEMAHMLKFQYVVAQQMGVPLLDPDHLFSAEGYEAGMLKAAFNAVASESLADLYKNCRTFNSLAAGNNVVLILFNTSDTDKVPGWDCLDAHTFSGAMLETINAKVGYLEAHFGPVVKPKLGEFTMAEVYKLVGIENP